MPAAISRADFSSTSGAPSVAFDLAKDQISGPIFPNRNGAVLNVLDQQAPSEEEFAKSKDTARERTLDQKRNESFQLYATNLIAAMEKAVLQAGKPFIGICVGMQLLAEKGFEHGEHQGLGWIAGEVHPIAPSDLALKIPHMGWNNISIKKQHALLNGVADNSFVYFVHSFAADMGSSTLATADYGTNFTAIANERNFLGCQFHPERSGEAGSRILKNFMSL